MSLSEDYAKYRTWIEKMIKILSEISIDGVQSFDRLKQPRKSATKEEEFENHYKIILDQIIKKGDNVKDAKTRNKILKQNFEKSLQFLKSINNIVNTESIRLDIDPDFQSIFNQISEYLFPKENFSDNLKMVMDNEEFLDVQRILFEVNASDSSTRS